MPVVTDTGPLGMYELSSSLTEEWKTAITQALRAATHYAN